VSANPGEDALREILAEGANCWHISRAERAAFIVDGESYFRAVRESICRAHHCVYIVGWDIHNELRMVREAPDDGFPNELGALLDAVARQRPDLNVYVLEWDFSMIYAMERDFFPRYKLRWRSHHRVHFSLDGEHPVGASQHQKIVVVDGSVAFCGGFDLSKWRWDTSSHLPEDKRRLDPNGESYPPFHDVQMVVDGAAARALSDIAHQRWLDATQSELPACRAKREHDPWPPSVDPMFRGIDIGIARTLPAYKDRDEVREVEQLYVDSIRSAQHLIYIENQFLSSHRVGQALARRLEEENGPEVIIVMPAKTGGWLEQHTMDVLRGRVLRCLRDADQHQRLRVYFVRLAVEPEVSLMIHAKVMIVDDTFARVGSSNISNRSMGLDSECDLAIESTGSNDCTNVIAGFRRRLLAEHLGVEPESVADAERNHPSLIEAIESLRGDVRSLEPLSGEVPPDVDEWVPDSALLDPEKPVEPDELLKYFVGPEQEKGLSRQLLKLGAILVVLIALAAAWHWTPLGEWLDVDSATAAVRWMEARPFTPLIVLLAYVVASLVVIPVTLMIVASVVVFGPWLGTTYALAGSELAALATFGLGALLGRRRVRKLAGTRINRIGRTLSNRGLLTIITLRIVPVAPFTVINVIAGVSDVRLRDFALGSFVGMLPGVLAVAFFTDRVVASIREPSATSIITAITAGTLAAVGLLGLRHWLRRRGKRGRSG
jgi:phospholipase D1/2